MADGVYSRRRLGALLGGATVTALAGAGAVLATGPTVRAGESSRHVGPDSRGLTDDERTAFVDEMATVYGSAAAERILPGSDGGDAGGVSGAGAAERVWDGRQRVVVTDDDESPIAESVNYVGVFSTTGDGEWSSDGYWLWSGARSLPAGEGGATLRTLWTHVDLGGGGELLTYHPAGDRRDNGTIGPHPERTGQDDDEYALRWTGSHDGTRVVAGRCVARRDGSMPVFDWNVHLDAVRD